MEHSFLKQHSSKKIETDYHTMWIENGILMQVYHVKLKRVTLPIAKSMVQDRFKISNGIAYPCYTDSNNATAIEEDARKYISGKEAHQLVIAFALQVRNPFAKLIGNFFLIFEPLKVPAKLFTKKEKALFWIKKYRHLS